MTTRRSLKLAIDRAMVAGKYFDKASDEAYAAGKYKIGTMYATTAIRYYTNAERMSQELDGYLIDREEQMRGSVR